MTTNIGKAQIAKDKCNFIGNVIAGFTPSGFTTYWNQITPENAGKWGSVESTRDVMNWTALDNAYKTAKDNGLPFKQHTFVWGQQQPNWMATLSLEEQVEEVEEWIQLFAERYPDTDFIDVVNEPLHAVPDYSTALGGSGTTGWDWVIWSFEKAREYLPNAKLILNDYNIVNNNSATDNYITIINILKERSLIDVIGEQGHFLESTPNATITGNLNKLYATGIPIHISEYDVNILDDTEQLNKYKEQFPILWTHPGVQGITFWGYRQGEIWRENAYLVRTNDSERPALTWLKSYIPTTLGGSFCLTTSVSEMDTEIKIYPNPSFDGTFTIEDIPENFTTKIFDLTGKEVQYKLVKDNQIMQLQLPNEQGMYILKFFDDGNRIAFKKIIIN